ncbi:unnamed protein product [Oikopleura dioica]|uniref:Apple domain-containing protein n=1 Tax=Oikopleura dioica TaxID=34765 RepID=E4YGT7_OIKDI|nr:unnamed protein product [Oikopleura dioica]
MKSRFSIFVLLISSIRANTEIKDELKELLKDSTVVNTLVDILDYKLSKKTEELEKKVTVEKLKGEKIVGNKWKEVNAYSDESCSTLCALYASCIGYNYLDSGKICVIFDSIANTEPDDLNFSGMIRRSYALAKIPSSPNDTAPHSSGNSDNYDLKIIKSAVAKHIHVCQKKFEFLSKKVKVTRDSLGAKIRSLEIDTSKSKCLKGGRPSACDNFAKKIEERNTDIYNAVLTYVEDQNAIKLIQEGMDTRLTEMGHLLATYQPVTVAQPAQDLIGSVLMQTKEMQNNVRIELESKIERNDAEMRRNQGAISNLRSKIDKLPLAGQTSENEMSVLNQSQVFLVNLLKLRIS